ncbi:MAG: hypothetical protein LBI87_08045 [Candidatus Accumulibacter sp.]|jgi:HemY protein|nr:hypothetical protein [Accumulibacter sp.]
MKSLFWILALFALAVGISLTMRVNEGYVLLVMPPYRVEVSLYFAVLLAVSGFAVFYALLRALSLVFSLPRRMRESQARRRRDKAAETFGEGVRLYLAGERRKAIDVLAGLRDGTWPALAATLAARAAGEIGATEEQRKWQSRAAELDPRVPPPAAIETDRETAREETGDAKN